MAVIYLRATRLELDGAWNLEELSDTSRDYIQLYGFAYSLQAELPDGRDADIDYIYGKFPWRGGYSTVNFFNQLFHKIPIKQRPLIKRIEYASPGFIEVAGLLIVFGIVAKLVKTVCSSIDAANDTYRKIQKGAADYELSRINLAREKLKLNQEQIDFSEKAAKKMAQALGLTPEQERVIEQRSGGNPVMKLKILLAVYRRVRPLAAKQQQNKLTVKSPKKED